jgi:hypothetical protein
MCFREVRDVSRNNNSRQNNSPKIDWAVTGGIDTITEFFGLDSSLLCYRSAGIL